jgi:hypothetical protein
VGQKKSFVVVDRHREAVEEAEWRRREERGGHERGT